MKLFAIISVSLVLFGCANMTEQEKRATWIMAGLVIAAATISTSGDSSEAVPICVDTPDYPDGEIPRC